MTLSRSLKGGYIAIDENMNKGTKFSGDAKFLRLSDAFVFGDNGDLKKKHKDFVRGRGKKAWRRLSVVLFFFFSEGLTEV